MLANSQWYVPSANLLAYLAPSTNLSEGINFDDQTTWSVTNSVNGSFSGTTTFAARFGPVIKFETSNTILNGIIKNDGQVSIQFTTTNGSVTVGIGHERTIDGTNAIELQMITALGSNSYITHWAYMIPYTGSNVPAPLPPTNPAYFSYESQWIEGTVWSLQNPSLFGTNALGTFGINGFTNGYFFGSGEGPAGGNVGNFTLNGSVTPEGTLLFNLINSSNGILTSLTGSLAGGPGDGSMSLSTYSFTNGGSNVGTALFSGSSNIYVGFTNSGQSTNFLIGTNSYNDAYVGYATNASGNQVLVSGSTTVLSNSGATFVGYEGSGNTLTISNGAKVFGGDAYLSALGGSNNSVVISGEGSEWSNSGVIQVAKSLYADMAGTGTLTILSGGTLAASNLIISGATNSVGTVEVGLKGGTNTNMILNVRMITFGEGTGSLGLNQSDTLTIAGSITGATATNSYAMIQQYGSGTTVLTGDSHTGTGYRVDGGQLRVDGGIFDIVDSAGASPDELGGPRTICIGNKYSGKSLVITNGGFVHSFVTIVGTCTQKNTDALTGTSNNWALITGDGSQLDAGELFIGNVSSGNSLMISNGGRVNCSLYTSIGASGSSNSVIVDGTGSLFSNAGSLELGSYSESNVSVGNSILITNGGGLFSGTATIASSTNSYGNSVRVTGPGSFWRNSGDLTLGDVGASNSLVIANGGSVYSSNGFIGYTNGSTGNSVIISGGIWNSSATNFIGYSGSGNTLLITNHGVLSDQDGFVGFNASSGGNNVLITGEGSMWTNSDILVIGKNGGGTLTVASGGKLVASQIEIGQYGDLDFGRYQQNDSAGTVVGNIVFTATNDENFGLNFNQANTFTFSNNITGPGWICALGTGTTVMSGSNSYSQYTKIDAGTIVAASTNALGTGFLQIGGTTNQATIQLASNLSGISGFNWAAHGVVALTPGSQVLTVSGVMSNVASGGGTFDFLDLTLNNAAKLLINFGSQTNFTTNSFSVEGILGYSFALTTTNVSAYIAPTANLLVSRAILFDGTLTASSLTITSGGSISGGGILNGNLNLQKGSAFVVNGPSTPMTVNGTATLGGSLVIATPMALGTKNTFLTATTVSGAFDSVLVPAGYRGRVVIEGDPVVSVIMAPASYTQMAQNRNQSNVATALNSFIPATSGDHLVVSTALDSLTASQYNQAFNAIMPSFYQQVATIAFNQANAQNMELNQRLWGLRVAEGGGFSMTGLADNYAMLQEGQGDGAGAGKGVLDSKKDILRPGLDNHWGMFVDGNGIFAQANSANMLPGYNSESGGVTAGLTYKWNKNVATGIYCGYEGTYTKSGANGSGLGTGSSLTDNAVRFGVFGTYGQENGKGFYANALAGGAYHNLQATRVIQFPGLNRTANSSPRAGELDTMLATGYDVQKGKFTFGPTASLQYTYLGVNGVNESGAQSLNFNSSGWNSSSMLSSLGAHAAYTWQASRNILVVPQISLNWQHEFLQNPYAINGNLGGTSPTFSNWSASAIRDYLYTGVGFTVEFSKKWNTSFFYNAVAGNQNLTSQNIFWSAGLKF
jgi:T5SS/PEP-CTERM-associated repeat protein/autotransporter-associated beta strand protein